MEKKFGLRDLVLYLFMVVILVSVWLAMFQIDRQWKFIALTQVKLEEQTRDIADLKRQLRRAGAIGTTRSNDPSGDPSGGPLGYSPGDPAGGPLHNSWRGFARADKAAREPDYASGDWLVGFFGNNIPTLTPLVSGDAYATSVQQWVLDTLATRDPETLEWLPLVAESWQTSDDGLRITFKIREGVTFSDGVPLTAEDVAFTYRFVMDPRIAAPRQRAYVSRIVDVVADGDEVTFLYAEPYFAAFDLAVSFEILPEHFYGKYLASVAAAEQFNTSTGLLLGSGPYRLASPDTWTPDQAVELIRNDRYWGWITPAFDRRIWKILKSDAAMLTEFKNNDIDLYNARPLQYEGLLNDEKVQANADHFEYYDARGGYMYIAWNQKREGETTIFSDPRVREAMTYLTDRERIVNEIFLGYAKVANGPYNPLGKQNNRDLPTRPYDPDKAKSLLAEAGFEDRDGDGILESADGKPFRFKLIYPAGSDDYKRMVLLLKDIYVRIGIVMEPDPTDWPILIGQLNAKNFDAISLGWTSGFEIDVYQMFHSSQTEPGGDNFAQYVNPELDVLLEAARREIDEPARMKIWQQVHAVLWRDQPYTFLIRGKRLDFISKRLHNVTVVKAGLNRGGLWRMPMEWYVPTSEQRYVQ